MTLDKKLFCLRKKEGLSQVEVSEKLDVSRQAVSRWESGEARPSTDNLQALCRLYHVPLDYLLNESEDEPPVPTSMVPTTERGPEQEGQEKRNRRIRKMMIGAVVLALLAGCFFWYESQQNKTSLDLHSIQGEDSTTPGEPDFSMTWE